MPRIGSDGDFVANNTGGVFDDNGNPIVTADTDFGASPLGIAARSQALYFLPNPSFNILPPDPSAPIVDNANALPYWSVEDLSEGRIVPTTVFDETTQTWALEIDPTAGSASDSITIKTRSYLLNDSNFDLRQKALASLEKVNSYSGTTQWAMTLGAEYFDAAGNSLSSYTIGTAADNATWTSLSGFTTAGTAIVDASAQYVDLTFALTTTAAVTSTVKVHINSLLLQTSSAAAGGGGGLLIAETFTSSGTWTRPTGVDYLVAVAGYGAGGGGASGRMVISTVDGAGVGGSGGGGGAWAIIKDLYVADVGSVSVGIGAGGAGGGTSFNYVGTSITINPIAGANGGATTFGSYLNIPGGGGGGTILSGTVTGGGGSAGAAATSTVFGLQQLAPGGGAPARLSGSASAGTSAAMAFSANGLSYTLPSTGGLSGGTPSYSFTFSGAGSVSFTAGTTGVKAGGGSSYSGGGAAGDGIDTNINDISIYALNTGTATAGGGGGGRAQWVRTSGTVTAGTWTAGSGGDGRFGGGGGGGGGGGVRVNRTESRFTITGTAGNGSDGFITVMYVA